jgi:hypothetical protein
MPGVKIVTFRDLDVWQEAMDIGRGPAANHRLLASIQPR